MRLRSGNLGNPKIQGVLTPGILSEVLKERNHMRSLDGKNYAPLDWTAAIGEKLEEADRLAGPERHGYEGLRRKLIQAAALAVAAVESLDRNALTATGGTDG